MACATPVVVSDRAASALLAISERDYLVAKTPQQFADAILDLLDDPQKRVRLGNAGRAYVEKYHDAHKIARDLVKIYEEVIEKNSKKKA